jgi:hypothetical protein
MRIRTIKPEFFRHENLAMLSYRTRLLFVGLWCLADAEGRLEDRPKRIRIDVFPYEVDDVDSDLQALCDAGFISRYTAQGVAVIEVTAFTKHQRISGKEAAYASQLPPMNNQGSNGEAPGKHMNDSGCFTDAQERSIRKGIRNKGEQGTEKPRRAAFSPSEFDSLLSQAMASHPTFPSEWHRWLTYRASAKKRVTEHAAKEQLRKIREAGIPAAIEAISKSIANDWSGLFFGSAPSAPAPMVRPRTFEEATAHIPPIHRGPRGMDGDA